MSDVSNQSAARPEGEGLGAGSETSMQQGAGQPSEERSRSEAPSGVPQADVATATETTSAGMGTSEGEVSSDSTGSGQTATSGMGETEETPKTPNDPTVNGKGKQDKEPDLATQVAQAEEELRNAQKELDKLKAQQAEEEKRNKEIDAIHTQQGTTQVVVARAEASRGEWDKVISPHVEPRDQSTIRGEIDEEFKNIKQAEDDVRKLKTAVREAERTQKIADVNLASRQAEHAEAQKQLSQLVPQIKEVQGRVEKLVAEVKSAVDGRKWSLAFGRNYQLDKTIEIANGLLQDARPENAIVTMLKTLAQQVKEAQEAATAAKENLDKLKNDLKEAEEVLKQKKGALDATIVSLSSRVKAPERATGVDAAPVVSAPPP